MDGAVSVSTRHGQADVMLAFIMLASIFGNAILRCPDADSGQSLVHYKRFSRSRLQLMRPPEIMPLRFIFA